MEKILVISTMYPSRRHPSFGIFIRNHVQALEKRGYQIDVAAVRDPRMNHWMIVKKYVVWFAKLFFIFLTKGKTYDLIHAHYVFPSGWAARLFKKVFRQRIIVTAHGGDLNKMARKGAFFFKATKKTLHEVDHIVAVGEKLRSDMITNFNVPKEKITLLNMGVDRTIFKPMDKRSARQMLNVDLTAKVILYVGNLLEAKGLIELVAAFKDLKNIYPDIALYLIGEAKEPHFAQRLMTMIHQENVRGIQIHSSMNQQAIALWMNAADVLVIPSHTEGFGLVALEAMACHTPVVGTHVGGLRYLLQDGAGLAVKPKQKTSLRWGLERVINDKHLQKDMLQRGEKRAREFDQERIVDQLTKLYHE